MSTGDVKLLRKYITTAQTIVKAQTLISYDIKAALDECLGMALAYTYRSESAIPRAPAKARRVTPDIAARVERLKAYRPDWTQQEIADVYGLGSGGRVSEILSGEYGVRHATR